MTAPTGHPLKRLSLLAGFILAGTAEAIFSGTAAAQTQATAPINDATPVNFFRLIPGQNPVTSKYFSQGTLVAEKGCFRLRQLGGASMAIIWPATARTAPTGKPSGVRDLAANWTAKPGDLIRLGGKTVIDLDGVAVDNPAARDCAPPYFVAHNIVKFRK